MSNKLSDIVNFNPSRILKKGTVAPFIEMASLPTNTKFIKQIDEKPFLGGSKFKNGDTLFARITPCLENGKTGKVTNLKDEMIGHGSTEFIVMSAKEPEFDEDYIYYFARLPEFREFAQQRMVGTSGRQRVAWQDLADFEFIFPPKEQRKKAAALLNIYDQKIDLNTQINQTLEQIAQALFKSWFVDFDPVRAKVQALSDGMSLEHAELAAMQAISGKTPEELTALSQTQPDRYAELAETTKAFPCEMVEVDGVEVPKGWEVKYLKDICNIVYGKNLPTTKLIKEGYPVFGGNGVIGYYDKFLYETPQTLVSCRGAASGKVLYSLPYSFVTNNSLVIEHEKSGLSYFYIYEALKLQNLTELTSGSAQPQMTIANMASVQILVPSEKINEVYKKYADKLYDKKYQNNIENEALAQTRNLLLPRLLSGDFND